MPFCGITECQCSNGTWRPFDQIPLRRQSPRKIKQITKTLLSASRAAHFYLIYPVSLHHFALGSQADLFGTLAIAADLGSPNLLETPQRASV